MARRQTMRGVKVCAHCGGGYDAFKAMEVRGRYCSPGCLSAAREAHRHPENHLTGPAEGLAPLSP
jgi:hypothetical protein